MMNSSMSVNAVKEGGVGASLSVEVAANSKAATEARGAHAMREKIVSISRWWFEQKFQCEVGFLPGGSGDQVEWFSTLARVFTHTDI